MDRKSDFALYEKRVIQSLICVVKCFACFCKLVLKIMESD